MSEMRDVLAATLPDVMSEETCLAVMGPGIDRLDCVEEWYMAPREMADAIIAALAERHVYLNRLGYWQGEDQGVTLTREPGLDGTTEAAIRAERARIRAGITEAMLVENQNRGAVKERQRILRWLDGEPSTAERIRAATPFPHGCAYCGNVHLAPEGSHD